MPDTTLPASSETEWDQTDAYYYNNWVDISIEPTRYLCGATLKTLGLFTDVASIITTSQLTDLATQPDDLYPDLVRQCLASAKVTYADPNAQVASEGVLSFFAGGKKYAIPIPEFCEVYGFDSRAEAVDLPNRFSVAHKFWDFIASGNYYSRSAAQSNIRNPALRIAVKAISTILFAKDDASKVRIDELIMLYNAVKDAIGGEPGLQSDMEINVNMGALFAGVIADKRTKVAKGKASHHAERIGSLLTRLFMHLGVDLSASTCITKKEFMNTAYLIGCEILLDTHTYKFLSRDKRVLFCRLPQPSLTELEVAANVGFTPGTEYLCNAAESATQSTPAPKRSTSQRATPAAPTADALLSDEEMADLNEATDAAQQSKTNWRRPCKSEFVLGEISENHDEAEYRRWMVDSTKKNNSLLRRVLHMLQKGCHGAQSTATMPSTAPVHPPAQPSPSARRSTRQSKRKRPLTGDEDSDHSTSD